MRTGAFAAASASIRYRYRRTLAGFIKGPLTRYFLWSARRRTSRKRGITVIAVNYNTRECAEALLFAVRRFSDPSVQIMVIDNASSDGSAAWLRSQPGVRVIRLPVNIHHGPAMNLGIARCRTDRFIALDIDAFPVAAGWLSALTTPLDEGVAVAGAGWPPDLAGGPTDYVHACCLAMSLDRFLKMRHTFDSGPTWDTAQRISQREYPNVHLLPVTSSIGPGGVGSVFGGVVYHNFYSARFKASDAEVIDEVNRGEEGRAWGKALAMYLPDFVPSDS